MGMGKSGKRGKMDKMGQDESAPCPAADLSRIVSSQCCRLLAFLMTGRGPALAAVPSASKPLWIVPIPIRFVAAVSWSLVPLAAWARYFAASLL